MSKDLGKRKDGNKLKKDMKEFKKKKKKLVQDH
jgi:hypothetical protein